ncbi:MAG: hypothetical protein AAB653_00810 [Patescibacteria group bacterium]
MKIKTTFLFSLIFALSFFTNPVKADTFDPNNIISDFEILNYTSMDLTSIKDFLHDKNSCLANYQVNSCSKDDLLQKNQCSGKLISAAEVIYNRAVSNKINPKFILVLLQKEQGLIEKNNPSQQQLDWATGYGCPDSAPCNERWRGFWKQVNSASLQFRDYLDNPQLYTYKANNTYTFTNLYGAINQEPITVTPVNQATAALYNYTPHVYNGNYNFYKLWQRYFTRDYFNGSLLQAQGEAGVWLIQDNKKRPFASKGALTSRFDIKKVIQVNKSDLDKYETGAPIKFAQYSLIRSPRGTIFLLVDDKKRGFSNSASFRKLGFNPSEVVGASWDDINAYADGLPITATSTYPTGTLLQDKKTGGVYWVIENSKAPLIDKIFLTTKFNKKKIIKATPEELAYYQTVDPVFFSDGELLKSSLSATVYAIVNGKKRLITSNEIFEQLGYKWENVITVSPKILYLYPEGDQITGITN